MANTKKLTREKRKLAKRGARLKMKATWAGLSDEQRRQFRKGDEKSLKKFLASLKTKEEAKVKEAAPAAPGASAAQPAEPPKAEPQKPPAQ